MKVTLLMAISINGMIARENGDEDFLSHENWSTFSELAKEFNNFIFGSRTYKAVKNWNEDYGFDDFTNATKVVMTADHDLSPGSGYVKANSPAKALDILSKKGFKKALITGGSATNTSFAKEGLIDEVVLNIEPVIIGKGIPLFQPESFQCDLELIKSKNINDQLIQLQYRVKK